MNLDIAFTSKPGTVNQVVRYMEDLGSGQTRIVLIEQPLVDHALVATNLNGEIYFIDGQIDKIVTLKPGLMIRVGYPRLDTPHVPWEAN